LDQVETPSVPNTATGGDAADTAAVADTTVTTDEAGDDKKYLHGLWLIPFTFAQLLVSTMAMLYALVLPTAIPSITSQFNSIADLDWYSTSYLLTK
jgi:hypothetical protein